jgi:archaellum component FlaC
MKKIELTIEKEDGHLWGRIEGKGDFMPTGQGATLNELIENVKDSIQDYQEHEGKTDKFWSKVDINKITFDVTYDLEAFFSTFDFLNVSSIAKKANINRSLLSQYASGIKHASAEQAKKIERVIRQLGKDMLTVELSG